MAAWHGPSSLARGDDGSPGQVLYSPYTFLEASWKVRQAVKAGRIVKKENEFTAPLGAARSGRLILAPGAGGVQIRAGGARHELCRVRFRGCLPAVRAGDGVVTIRYHALPFVDRLAQRPEPRAEIGLNAAIPWEIELRGRLSRLAADLVGLALRSLDLNGDAGRAHIWLPLPSGTVYVHAGGSLGRLVLRRPEGVALRIQVTGGQGRLACDGQRLAVPPGGVQWQTAGYAAATDRYDVRIAGHAGRLAIATWVPGSRRAQEIERLSTREGVA
jgi:hypothetical protein